MNMSKATQNFSKKGEVLPAPPLLRGIPGRAEKGAEITPFRDYSGEARRQLGTPEAGPCSSPAGSICEVRDVLDRDRRDEVGVCHSTRVGFPFGA